MYSWNITLLCFQPSAALVVCSLYDSQTSRRTYYIYQNEALPKVVDVLVVAYYTLVTFSGTYTNFLLVATCYGAAGSALVLLQATWDGVHATGCGRRKWHPSVLPPVHVVDGGQVPRAGEQGVYSAARGVRSCSGEVDEVVWGVGRVGCRACKSVRVRVWCKSVLVGMWCKSVRGSVV